jgi:hypothetical protein
MGKGSYVTAVEVMAAVEKAGGRLWLASGNDLGFLVPSELTAYLVMHRDAIVQILKLWAGDYVGKDNRCHVHGVHGDWYQHSGDGPGRVCARCHPNPRQPLEWVN